MLRLPFVLTICAFFFTCESNVKKSDLPLTGKEIFRRNCVLCHGIKGNLMTNGAKDLRFSDLSLEDRILVISKGRNVMTGFGEKLTKEEIKLVAEFTISLKQ
ncbi:MAG: c-type cytochrome [Saprospiraceae bacterium]|nr:c-type cytochrome [Saprospiraceae bacterium]